MAQPDGRAEVITRSDHAYGWIKEPEIGNTQSGQGRIRIIGFLIGLSQTLVESWTREVPAIRTSSTLPNFWKTSSRSFFVV